MKTEEDSSHLVSLDTEARQLLINYGVKFKPEIIVRAEGVFLYTASGQRLLDFTSGQMAALLGHAHPEVVRTINRYASQLCHLLSGHLSPPVLQLATALTQVLPSGLDRVMFLSTGSESCEAAIRLAKVFTGKYEIVGLGSSWHGMTGGSVGAQYASGRKGCGPMIPGNLSLPAPNPYRSIFRKADGNHDWETELEYGWQMVDQNSCGSLAAVIAEPILSSGGMLVLPHGYLNALKVHCQKRNMLLILDEAQTGLGRCGDLFAFQGEGVIPDILTLSKTLGSGMAISAVVCSESIASYCEKQDFLFCTTHVSDPLPVAVGLTVLEVVLRDNLAARSSFAGRKLHDSLRKLQSRYGCIGDVRGRGLLAGIEIVADRVTKEPDAKLGAALARRMTELGLSNNLTVGSSGGLFRIAPPLIITDEQLELGLELLEAAFQSTEGTMPLYDELEAVNGTA